jgi:putative transposase
VSYVDQDQHKEKFGVEPICAALSSAGVMIAPSTYYAARNRPPSARAVRDEQVKPMLARVHAANYGVYGVRKVHAQLARDGGVDGRPVARCTVARLMRNLSLRGVSRARSPRTTICQRRVKTDPSLPSEF